MSINGRCRGKENDNFPLRRSTLRKGLGVEDYKTCYGKLPWLEVEVHEEEKMWFHLSQDKLQKPNEHLQQVEWTEQIYFQADFSSSWETHGQ